MSTPDSLSPAPLTSLGDFSYKKLIDDDFSVGKASLKAKASSSTQGSAAFKGWLDLARSNTPGQEIKFQFPYNNLYFWFATRQDQTKVHVDFGKYKLIKEQNIFANVQFFNSSRPATVRLGAVHKGEKCLAHARLEYVNHDELNLLNRAQVRNGNWVYTVAQEVCLNKQQYNKLDLLVGYQAKDYDVYFRHLTAQRANIPLFSNFGIGRVVFDYIHRVNSNTFGFEAEYTSLNNYRVVAAASTKKNDIDFKGRVDVFKKTLGLVAKGKLNSRFNWTVSAALPLDGSKPKQIGALPLPIGFTLETTV